MGNSSHSSPHSKSSKSYDYYYEDYYYSTKSSKSKSSKSYDYYYEDYYYSTKSSKSKSSKSKSSKSKHHYHSSKSSTSKDTAYDNEWMGLMDIGAVPSDIAAIVHEENELLMSMNPSL